MITKMTKYSFILMTEEKDGFLEQLQELGVVDISRSVKPVDQDSSEILARASRAKKTLEFLESIDYTKDADAEAIARTTVEIDGDPVAFVDKCQSRLANKDMLETVCKKKGVRLCVVDDVYYSGEKVSTTLVKKLLSNGDPPIIMPHISWVWKF